MMNKIIDNITNEDPIVCICGAIVMILVVSLYVMGCLYQAPPPSLEQEEPRTKIHIYHHF